MLESYFETSSTLEELRSRGAGAYLDGFAGKLKCEGYSRLTARSYLRIAAHLSCFLERQGTSLEYLDLGTLRQFRQHLPDCRCSQSGGGSGKWASRGARCFFEYLRSIEALRCVDPNDIEGHEFPLVDSFRGWLKQHCGAAESTVILYGRGATLLAKELGDDPSRYNAQALRAFVLERARCSGIGATKALIKASRAFLRYLATAQKCTAGLDQAVPSVAGWRLATLPRSLSSSELERTIDVCDLNTARSSGSRHHPASGAPRTTRR